MNKGLNYKNLGRYLRRVKDLCERLEIRFFVVLDIFLAPGFGQSQYGSGSRRAKSMRIHAASDLDPQHWYGIPEQYVTF